MPTLINFGGGGTDTSMVTATPPDVLESKIFVDSNGEEQIGTMPNNGDLSLSIDTNNEGWVIPKGYHNGNGTVIANITNLNESNVKAGVNVGGVIGIFTADANATAENILKDKIAYVNGNKITGTMENQGNKTVILTSQNSSYTIPQGYHSGAGKVTASITNLTAANIKDGVTVGGVDGIFTSDGTATASQILSGKIAYVQGSKITGTMANQGSRTATLTTQNSSYTIPQGYHSGTGKVTANITNLTAANIRDNVTVGGITGTFTSDATADTTKVVSGYTFYREGAKHTGILVSRPGTSTALSCGHTGSGGNMQIFLRFHTGAYITPAPVPGYPEVAMNFTSILNELGSSPASDCNCHITNVASHCNVRAGNNVGVVAGTIKLGTWLYRTTTSASSGGNNFWFCMVPCWIAQQYCS